MGYLIAVAAPVLLFALLAADRKDDARGRLVAKTLLSLLFVLTGAIQPRPVPTYATALLAGLGLCVAGDVCLALRGNRAFVTGLFSFLLGHVAYCVAFFGGFGLGSWGPPVGLIAVATSTFVFLWLRPRLGTMRYPVLAYAVVITVMVTCACSLVADLRIPRAGRALMACGAIAFYLSDLTVARNRFVAPGFRNRLIGLPLYYAGQFMLALSIGKVA